MSNKMKYVKIDEFDSIIIFPDIIMHSDFRYLKPISAGFCYINEDSISCFGESISLRLKTEPEDSEIATRQYFKQY